VGSALEIIQVAVTCLIGAYGLSMALIGHGIAPMKLIERPLAVAAAICLVIPEFYSDILGVVLMLALLGIQWSRKKKAAAQAA